MLDLFIDLFIAGFVFQLVLTFAGLCTWFERKVSALMQDRIGANRAGTRFKFSCVSSVRIFRPCLLLFKYLGVLGLVNTFFCDPIKALFKEDFVPNYGNKFCHTLAPIVAVLPVFVSFAVLPFAPKFFIPFREDPILVQILSIDGGVLLIVAMGALAASGVMLAGWSSNNKFSLLGGFRAAAQLLSYELPMIVVLLCMTALYQVTDLYQMVLKQGANFSQWGICKAPLAALILFIVGMVESKRTPFDLPEAESELVAGYLTEYSGMKFFLFWIAEFSTIALSSCLLVLMFFSGWNLPFFEFTETSWQVAIFAHIVFLVKVIFFCLLQIVIRWTLPRFRYDQVLNLGWKYLLPIAFLNLLFVIIVQR